MVKDSSPKRSTDLTDRRMKFVGRQNIFVKVSTTAHPTLKPLLSKSSMFQGSEIPGGRLARRGLKGITGFFVAPPFLQRSGKQKRALKLHLSRESPLFSIGGGNQIRTGE
jgi:hypothetical protein